MNHAWLQMNNPSGKGLQRHDIFELPPSPPVTPHGSVTLVSPTSTHPQYASQQYHRADCDSTKPNQNFVNFLPHAVSTYQTESQQNSVYSVPSNNMMHQNQYFPACRQQTTPTSYQHQSSVNITPNQQNQSWGTSGSQNSHQNYWQNNYQPSTFLHQNAFQNNQLSNFQTVLTTQQHQDPPSLQGPFLPEPLQQQSMGMGNSFPNQAYTQPRNAQTHNGFQRSCTTVQYDQHFQPTNIRVKNHPNKPPPYPHLRQNFPQLRQQRFNPIKRLNYRKPLTPNMIISPPQIITYKAHAKEMQHISHSVDPNKKPFETPHPTKNLSSDKKSKIADLERYVNQHTMSEVGQGDYYNQNYQNQHGNFDNPKNGHFPMQSCILLPKYSEKEDTQTTKNGKSISEKHAIATSGEIQKNEDVIFDNFLLEIIKGAVNPDGSEAQVEDIPFDLKCQFESLS